jgi:hypothetical protein
MRPFLKMLFNPNPLIQALHIQADLNQRNAERWAKREQLDALHYEVIHNLVVEVTRNTLEVKSLKMRLESIASRLDFDERRARALEGVVQYRPGTVPAQQPPTGQDRGRPDRRDQRDQRPQGPRPQPQQPPPGQTPPGASADQPAGNAFDNEGNERRSRRRRRRGRRRPDGRPLADGRGSMPDENGGDAAAAAEAGSSSQPADPASAVDHRSADIAQRTESPERMPASPPSSGSEPPPE